MALPHMPSAYTTRKNIYEAAIVRKRNHDSDFREKWCDTARYFNQNDVETTKQRAWQSETSFRSSMDAWKAENEKEDKQKQLRGRRLRLARLLKDELDQYQAELKGNNLSKDNYSRIEDMRDRSEALKSAREDERKLKAEELLYEHWRQNNPDIRALEQNQHKEHVVHGWEEQVAEMRIKEEEERLAKIEMDRKLEENRLAALELERQREQEKLDDEIRTKKTIVEQMKELKERESEAKRLKVLEDTLMREQWELAKLEEERKAREKERKKMEFGRVLLRQHTAALRRKSQMIQKELEEDRKFLQSLEDQAQADQQIQTARREKAAADATWMKQVIEEQIRVEKAREAELDMLYQDEAARQWEKRESEWAKERQARERLMKEVLDARQDQVQVKMDEIARQQEESLERREELLRDMELMSQLTRREMEDQEAAKSERKQALEAQISSRVEREEAAQLRFKLDLDDEHKAEEDYEEMLRGEAQRLKLQGYTPRPSVRKQAWD